MKKLKTLFVLLLFAITVIAQVPESFKYQAVIRDAAGNVRANANVSIDIAVIRGSADGSQVFIETHSVASNAFGLVNLEIGSKNTSGFANIDWTSGPFFVKVSVNGTEMGTSQLLSVPFALYAKTAGNGFNGDYNDLQNKPDFSGWDNNATDDFSGIYDDLSNKPSLFSGNYSDLTNQPVIHAIEDVSTSTTSLWSSSKINTELSNKANLSGVYTKTDLQTSGQATLHYNNISNKPVNLDLDKTDDVTLSGNQTIGGEKIFTGTIRASNGINMNDEIISNVAPPYNNGDAVNKAYVDLLLSRIEALESLIRIEDIDGNLYNMVRIGSQIWMVQNLKTTHYNNGDPIGTTDPLSYDIGGETSPKYQWPANGDENNVVVYGRLYTWYTVMDSRGLCPSGWHVPTYDDWATLSSYLGGDGIAGSKLREAGTAHWESPNVDATNESGFTALPAGDRGSGGNYPYFHVDNYLWSSTSVDTNNAWGRKLIYYGSDFQLHNYSKLYGFSVRCIKDE